MKTWLQLFRAPNLFTVPGDPLAGFLLASAGATGITTAILPVILASLSLYGFGLLLNDLMDFNEDRLERPGRPLPGGAVEKRTVWVVAILLVILGLATCASIGTRTVLCGGSIATAVAAYDCGLKKVPVISALNMGLCRGLNLLLGATLAHSISPAALGGGFLIGVYITGVTLLARSETRNPAIPPLIGKLIRGLILVQAGLCAVSGAGLAAWASAAVLTLALWPLSIMAGKRFYSS
jgi:4-hydroxybenzoate polyprenyltransferase